MRSSFSTYWRSLADKGPTDLPGFLLLILLIPFSITYSLIQRLRLYLYEKDMLRKKRLPRPVISIGNITVGGTGKTPVTAYIAHYLLEKGLKVAVLSRGYGGAFEGKIAVVSDGKQLFHSAEECGDEPFLLAKTLPGLMVVIGSDRHAAGMLAMEELSPHIFLLDDGYQHLRLHRDLNILLLDQKNPFGNGWTLPAGLLREPQDAVKRSDLTILTRCSDGGALPESLQGKAVFKSRHRLSYALPLTGGETVCLESFQDKKILAFAGIGAPESFFEGLRKKGLAPVATLSFSDHATYDTKTITALVEAAETVGVDFLITTEKDGVKLGLLPEAVKQKTMLARLELEIENETRLQELLLQCVIEKGTDAPS